MDSVIAFTDQIPSSGVTHHIGPSVWWIDSNPNVRTLRRRHIGFDEVILIRYLGSGSRSFKTLSFNFLGKSHWPLLGNGLHGMRPLNFSHVLKKQFLQLESSNVTA